MNKQEKRKVYVVGHKNPDTDSICSAIAYANLKKILTGDRYTPRRAGQLNEETQYVLDRFGVKAPKLLPNLRLQVKNVELHEIEGQKGSDSIKEAWATMKEKNINTLPVLRNQKLEGLITVGDIAQSYMNVYDSRILCNARTQYRNILSTIEGTMVTGNEHGYLLNGKVGIAASSRQLMSDFIEKDDLAILGNRVEAQELAIDLDVSCMVICQSKSVSEEIIRKAEEKEIVIISTPLDTFTVARLINQSIPIKHFMTRQNLVTFKMNEYVDDVKDIMTKHKFRDFPIVDNDGNFLGFISRRRLLKAHKKEVILVDHNEKNQAVDGIEEAEVLEIIDHHRISSIETMGPVFFRNQPVGCTSTIVYQMYLENDVEITPTMAGLMCSAILSDTLMFRSPTCTPLDEATAKQLAKIAEINVEEFSKEMFNAGSNLRGKTPEEICFLDFKQFTVNDTVFGVGQVNSMNEDELDEIKKQVTPYLEVARENHNLDMIFFMLTNIITESSELICCGESAREEIVNAYDLDEEAEKIMLKGVVSRKKQLVPTIVGALQQ